MKKLITILLTLSFIFGIAACASTNKDVEDKPIAPTVNEFTAEGNKDLENVFDPIFTIKFNNPDEVRISQITINGEVATILESEQTTENGVTTVTVSDVVGTLHTDLTKEKIYMLDAFKWRDDFEDYSVNVTSVIWTYEAPAQ
ncbi:hypothetical protein KHQ81_00290 [Mycoplasmatota bacterium]|nr:hypothetical protein KHQ81_00290 [Mycoplasmatota bacterium]